MIDFFCSALVSIHPCRQIQPESINFHCYVVLCVAIPFIYLSWIYGLLPMFCYILYIIYDLTSIIYVPKGTAI